MAEYQKGVVTFLDILGFRNLVQSDDAEEIDRILNTLMDTAANDGFFAGITEVLSFSDSIVRVSRHTDTVHQAFLFEASMIAEAQCKLASGGILIRGGMTTGDVHTSKQRVFGPAFVRAYELENRFASAPRIIVDPTLIPLLRSEQKRQTGDGRFQLKRLRQTIRQGDDGLWFIDYLRSTYAADDPSDHAAFMRGHRAMILQKTAGINAYSPYLPKYLWLARYHNRIASALHKSDRSLRISRLDVPMFDELLIPRPRV